MFFISIEFYCRILNVLRKNNLTTVQIMENYYFFMYISIF